jgi:hypothetical protein
LLTAIVLHVLVDLRLLVIPVGLAEAADAKRG